MNGFPMITSGRPTRRSVRTSVLLLLVAGSTALTTAAGAQPHFNTVSLKVTVNANQQFAPLTGNPTDVSPDSLGQYVDGQNGVCASLNTDGDLIIGFDCATASTPRRLGLNLVTFLANPTGGIDICTPPTTISSNNPPVAYTNNVATATATDMPTAPFQTMNVYDGTAATIYYIQLFLNYSFSDASQTTWRLNYHRTTSSTFADAALGSYAEVRRLSSTQWVVEPVTPSRLTGNPPNAAMLVWQTSTRHSSTITECGFYQVPFSFTLDQK
jgi:hypothetical protein